MKRSWAALAVSLFALGVLAGCNDYNNSIQYSTGATLTNISPSSMPAGTPSGTLTNCPNTPTGQSNPCFTLYVVASPLNPFTSTGVLPVVQWNGQNLPTTFIDTTDVSAQVPYSLIAKPGSAAVNTFQPQNLGTGYNGLSNALTFLIYGAPNPFPVLSSVSATSAAYCDSTKTVCADVPITLTGSNFLPVTQNGGSSVSYTGLATYGVETAISVTSITSTQLNATIPGKLLCATDTARINVINPPSAICLVDCPNLGGGDTNNPPAGQQPTTQTFTVTGSSSVNSCPANTPVIPLVKEAAALSQDGRYVAYPTPQSGSSQIVLRDTCLGAAGNCTASTRAVSVAADGAVGNADSHNAVMTPDGRYVAFSSAATNLAESAPGGRQIYLRDTCIGAPGSCKPSTLLVSADEQGQLAGAESILPSLSTSGRFVAFLAVTSRQLAIPGKTADANAMPAPITVTRQVFVRDTCLGTPNCSPKTTRISLQPDSTAAGSSKPSALAISEEAPAISQDGRFVAYSSAQDDKSQILLRDTCLGVAKNCSPSTQIISAAADGSAGNADSHNAVMTPDGGRVAFSSAATNLVENAPLGRQIYLRETCLGAAGSCKPSTILASTDEQGQLAGTESILPSLSTAGRFVAFLAVTPSSAARAVAAPNSGLRQVFVRDTCLGAAHCSPKTTRIALQPGDAPVDSAKPAGPALAGLARQIALVGSGSSTVFTPTVPVDDGVFLAIPNATK